MSELVHKPANMLDVGMARIQAYLNSLSELKNSMLIRTYFDSELDGVNVDVIMNWPKKHKATNESVERACKWLTNRIKGYASHNSSITNPHGHDVFYWGTFFISSADKYPNTRQIEKFKDKIWLTVTIDAPRGTPDATCSTTLADDDDVLYRKG